jgi:hypothetical protein
MMFAEVLKRHILYDYWKENKIEIEMLSKIVSFFRDTTN